ncbi:hypothetical protein LI172_10490 [Coprococcus catus]|uniref:hypothetical protein n=1 Tax=Coprococcus catus TaxID=116085 RepID=UPI001D096210|nr:hypothetical protein [Coprococcus catus]MCB6493112.1 hypothetical protein [Coprococcus catus]
MTGWQYLKKILTKEQMQAVRFAKKYGYTIIVSGPQGPTGKTTVTRILRKLGIDACEKYLTMEIEVDKPLENYEVDTEKFFKSIKFSDNGEE